MLNGFFDIDFRLEQLDQCGDPLTKLNKVIPWEEFRADLEKIREKERKSNAGRKPFDVILMFKILILQSLYNLGDDAVEYQIRDHLSFMRFLGLNLDDRVSDAKTVWLFREQLGEYGLEKKAFAKFDHYLRGQGFTAKKGQIIDASIIASPIQRNSRDENARIKQGEAPEDWSDNKRRQKDTDAKWFKKNGKNHFGYKNHIQVDVKHKFIRGQLLTPLFTTVRSSRNCWMKAIPAAMFLRIRRTARKNGLNSLKISDTANICNTRAVKTSNLQIGRNTAILPV